MEIGKNDVLTFPGTDAVDEDGGMYNGIEVLGWV